MPDRFLVLYHAGCLDGFCAAWLVHKKYPQSEFVAVQYGEPPPDVAGRDVLVLDFSYKRDVMLLMREQAKSLLVLDHHKSAEEELRGLDFCVFDMEKSGASLTLDWLRGIGIGPMSCWLVDYVEDGDLWRWELPMSREVNVALRSYPMTFRQWNLFDDIHFRLQLSQEGTAILRAQQRIVEQHVRFAKEVTIAGYKVLCVNATMFHSDIAGQLAEGRPFGVTWFESADGRRIYQLRSREGGVDVSEIAKRFGGGGHRNAAGFTMDAGGD